MPECTWVLDLSRQRTGSRGTTAPAAPCRVVHRSRRGAPSKPVRLQREFGAHKTGHPPAGVRAGYHHSSRTVRWHGLPAVKTAGGRVLGSRKTDMQTYDRGTSAARLQSCFCRRWRVVTSRRPKENCLCNRKVPQLQQSSYQHEPKDVTTIWTWHTETAAEKTHPSTLLPLGTTGQDETALQDDRPVACVGAAPLL